MLERRTIHVMAVEPHPTLREGLLALLNSQPDIKVVSAPVTAREALLEFHRHSPEVSVVDGSLPGVSELVAELRSANPTVRIITIVDYDWDGERLEFLEDNSSRLLPKDQVDHRLLPLIRDASST